MPHNVLGIICPGGDVVLFDPQMHTYLIGKLLIHFVHPDATTFSSWPGPKNYPDKGQQGIDEFQQDHKCNAVCHALQLSKPALKGKAAKRPWCV